MSKAQTVTAVVIWIAASMASAQQAVLSGVPTAKVESSPESTSRVGLSDAEAAEYRAIIVNRDGRYYWASRENRELRHEVSGIYHLFFDPSGGGYLKVESPSDGNSFRYYEHLNLGLATITYWGYSDKFSP